jgi:hypothetical protein
VIEVSKYTVAVPAKYSATAKNFSALRAAKQHARRLAKDCKPGGGVDSWPVVFESDRPSRKAIFLSSGWVYTSCPDSWASA